MEPLHHLLSANVADACILGLLEVTSLQQQSVDMALGGIWSGHDLVADKWSDSTAKIFDLLDRQHRPWQAYRGQKVLVTRVFPIRDLHYLFKDLPSGLASDPDVIQALDTIRSIGGGMTARVDMEAAFDELRVRVCSPMGSGVGTMVYAKTLVAPSRPCWVGRRPRSFAGSSQQWRNRLGLEHYPHLEGRARPSALGDALVRVSFRAALANSVLPRLDPKALVQSSPTDMWLVRPAAIHGGNPRFVQRQAHDTSSAPRKHGRTIDIGTTAYSESERELILVFGERAQVQWHDMELFDGLPVRQTQDDDHAMFVATVGTRLGW